jgi:competence protein ComEC
MKGVYIMRKKIIAVLLACVLCLITSCTSTPYISPEHTRDITPDVQSTEPPISKLTVHFIDVGQADAALVQCVDDTMLIDGGNVADSNLIIAYLKKQNITKIDYMICSHAHEDHVGGLSAPLSVMPVGAIYAPAAESDSKAYQNFKRKAAEQNTEIIHPVNYESFPLGSSNVEIIASPLNADNLNNTSIILKVTHKNKSFLFTGDAEREEEQKLLDKGLLKSDVLKVGHHGSDTSTSYPFLREIMPESAVISVGKDNSYGHPSETVLSRLRDADAQVYRTDLQGDIIMTSDGNNITVTTAKNEDIQTNETSAKYDEGTYIGNKNSKKFHRPDCRTLPSEKNRIEIPSRSEAINKGYSSCGNCQP